MKHENDFDAETFVEDDEDIPEVEDDEELGRDDVPLIVGEFIRLTPGGSIYRVDMVNEARARCSSISTRMLYEGDGEEGGRKFVNISPNSVVVRISREAAIKDLSSKGEKMAESAVVGIPVAETSRNEREQNRRAEMAEKKNAKKTAAVAAPLAGAAKAAKAKAAANPKPPKTVRACLCGCGEETTGYFAPGHDARFKSWMVKVERGTMEVKDLPKPVQKAYEFKKTKTGFVTTLNYRGDKHSGYDNKRA